MNYIDTLKQDLLSLNQEALALRNEISRLETCLETAKTRLSRIDGSGYRGFRSSEIYAKERAIDQAILEDADSRLPAPVWAAENTFAPKNQVITRVTPKQIYLRTKGVIAETIYKKDTVTWGFGAKLDVPATIAAWEAYRA
jgi:hypothetical protein